MLNLTSNKLTVFSLTLLILAQYTVAKNTHPTESCDYHQSDGMSMHKWASLKSVIQEAKLELPDVGFGEANNNYGKSVAIDGNRAIIGAPSAAANGAAYIVNYDGANWIRSQVLVANDGAADDMFGFAVSLQGDKALVGSYGSDNIGSNSGSAYVFELSNGDWVQTAKIVAGDANDSDRFGYAVSLSGNRALIGAYGESENGFESGAAYIFDKSGSSWSQSAKLTANDAQGADRFAYAVSIFGNRAVVGSYQDDDNGSNSGSVYVYDLNGSNWQQTTKLTANDGAVNDFFGETLSLDNNRLLIGAHRNDDNGEDSGSAYIFDFNGSSWSQTTKLLASDGAAFDSFGKTVVLSGNRALIGALDDDDNGNKSGAAYVFELSGGSWSEKDKLTANDGAANDNFGVAVGLSANHALVGAFLDDDDGMQSGSAYIFTANGNSWSQSAKLTAGDGGSFDRFGYSVSLYGNRALIGVYRDDVNGLSSGSAYVYEVIAGNWVQTAQLLANDGGVNDEFGISVSLYGDRALIGAHSDNDGFEDSGSAYVFDYNGSTWSQTAKLNASDIHDFEYFGKAVSLYGNRALIGKTNDDTNGSNSGSAYVFELNNGNWTQTAKLMATTGVNNDLFGKALSLSDDRALIGTIGGSGSAYIFDYNGSSWSQTAKLTSLDGFNGDNFGSSVSLFGDRALIGAKDNDDNGTDSGAVYVFDLFGGSWPQTAKLTANESSAGDKFGVSVSLQNDIALIGAFNDDDNGSNSGSAYLFSFDNGWSQSEKITATDGANDDRFGYSVSLSSSRALIGAYGDSDRGAESGSAYIVVDDIIFVDGFE